MLCGRLLGFIFLFVCQVVVAQSVPYSKLLLEEKRTIELFKQAKKSVVFISTSQVGRNPFSMNIMRVPRGSGSGFVWDNKGHVVTNFHVIQGADTISATFYNGEVYKAKLVGQSPAKDLAVLKVKIPAKYLKPLKVGSSEKLLVGQKVFAIGNPFGLDYSLSSGLVSALGREMTSFDERTIHNVIQIDADINPGNSGGPLLDSMGQLIGVNTQIVSAARSSAGIGFSIPSQTVSRIVPQIIRFGKVLLPSIQATFVGDGITRRNDIEGAIVKSVQRGGVAHRAGIRGLKRARWGQYRIGDIIIGIDNKPIKNRDELLAYFEKKKPGDTVTLIVARGKQNLEVKVKLSTSGDSL